LLTDLTPAGKDFEKCSDSGGLGKWHLIEVYFCGVGVIAMGGIKPKLRSDRKEYISAKLAWSARAWWEVRPPPLWIYYLGR
jgi:hypothetical protein